jgi:hypothetical protein
VKPDKCPKARVLLGGTQAQISKQIADFCKSSVVNLPSLHYRRVAQSAAIPDRNTTLCNPPMFPTLYTSNSIFVKNEEPQGWECAEGKAKTGDTSSERNLYQQISMDETDNHRHLVCQDHHLHGGHHDSHRPRPVVGVSGQILPPW